MIRISLITGLITASLLFSGCVERSPQLFEYSHGFFVDIKKMAHRGLFDLSNSDYKDAHKQFSWGLKYDPTNCQLNFLNSLTYQLEGNKGDLKKLELAQEGYKITIRFCAYDPWPHYYYGLLLSKLGEYSAAEYQHDMAYQYGANIDKQKLLDSYLISAYNNGDYTTSLRLLRLLNKIDPDDKYASIIKKKLDPLALRKANPDKVVWKSLYERLRQKRRKLPHAKKQAFLDAIIILSRETDTNSVGDNLLDNLKLTYAMTAGKTTVDATAIKQFYRDTKNDTGSVQSISTPTMPFTGIITHDISIPAITYSLNIFNETAVKAEILARPSLLVEDGQKARYFSGIALTLGIQGTQTGTIQEKEVGVTLEVQPQFNKDNSIDLNVHIGRQFIQPITAGETTFQQAVNTIKDNTQTTVNLRYGETVILSSLAENVYDDSNSHVPFLGELPLFKYIFSFTEQTRQNNHVIVLLTPRPYSSFDSDINNKEAEQRLNKLYHRIVNPSTNTDRILQSLQFMRTYRQPVIDSQILYDKEFLKQATNEEYQLLTEENQ